MCKGTRWKDQVGGLHNGAVVFLLLRFSHWHMKWVYWNGTRAHESTLHVMYAFGVGASMDDTDTWMYYHSSHTPLLSST